MTIKAFKGPYSFLSNFAPSKIIYEGIAYPTAEHAYQSAKTIFPTIKLKISTLETPVHAKKFGRSIKPLPDNWGSVRIDKMRKILRIKFALSGFRDSLLRTGDQELTEGNTWGDKFWGQCDEEGSNWLGKLLMEIREEIKNDSMS